MNKDHSASSVKYLIRSRLFPERRSKRIFWQKSWIKRRKKK